MLVLTRTPGQIIVIKMPDGREVRVKLANIEGQSRVRLGIAAPREMKIVRDPA